MANHTILLIDYEPRSIERFRDPLIAAGFAVEIATDGVSGIEAFHRLNPDMVLVEAMIPKKHGFEVCQELKRTPHGRRTPVIITTGVYKGRKYRTQALHIYGCDEYIEKPIAPEQLLEIVGKFFGPGASGPSVRAREAERSTPDTKGGPSPRGGTDAIAKPPPAVAKDDTEDEIMARLDAIMPGGGSGGASPVSAARVSVAPVSVAPVSVAPKRIPIVTAGEQDPFAQMRAELDAELGAIPEPFAFESAPKLEPIQDAIPEPMPESIPEPTPEAMPSDQVMAPSVLEALPIPEVELPNIPLQAPTPAVKDEPRGQIANFDSKRNRKNKKADKQNKSRTQPAAQVAPAPEAIAPPPKVVAPPPQVVAPTPPVIASRPVVSEVTLPRGTIVEAELDSTVERRGMPFWVWAAVGVVAIAALFFVFRPGATNPATVVSNPAPAQAPAPAASVPAEAPPSVPAPSATVPDNPAPVAAATKAAVPKKAPDRPPTATPTSTAAASKKAASAAAAPPVAPPTNTAPSTPEPAAAAPATIVAAKVAPPEAPPAPDVDTNVAGVETDADPAAGASADAAAIKRGELIPIDVADTMPVAVSRQAPVYSMEAKELKLSGTVIMNVLVNDHGTVDQVVLVTGVPGADVNDAAMRAAKAWTYRPATKNGIPVKVWKSEQIVFKL